MKQFRWRLIPTLLMALIGAASVVAFVGIGATMLYYNLKYGPIQDSGGKQESLDQIALTAGNFLRLVLYAICGVSGLAGSRYWFSRRRRAAIIATVVLFVAMAIGGANLPQ